MSIKFKIFKPNYNVYFSFFKVFLNAPFIRKQSSLSGEEINEIKSLLDQMVETVELNNFTSQPKFDKSKETAKKARRSTRCCRSTLKSEVSLNKQLAVKKQKLGQSLSNISAKITKYHTITTSDLTDNSAKSVALRHLTKTKMKNYENGMVSFLQFLKYI